MKHISRIEQNGRGYWWVRFFTSKKAGKQGHKAQKAFSDLQYKGTQGALRAAIKWRDEQLAAHPAWCVTDLSRGKEFHASQRGRRSTDRVGVSYRERKGYSPAFVVSWMQTIEGKRVFKQRQRSFKNPDDLLLYYNAAVEFRKQMERQHYEGPVRG